LVIIKNIVFIIISYIEIFNYKNTITKKPFLITFFFVFCFFFDVFLSINFGPSSEVDSPSSGKSRSKSAFFLPFPTSDAPLALLLADELNDDPTDAVHYIHI
jgi:hypothetical protein